jgi:acyl-CoA thioesterase FadM
VKVLLQVASPLSAVNFEPEILYPKRFTRIERVADGQLLCAAETQWVLLDAGSSRPVRVPGNVAERLMPIINE